VFEIIDKTESKRLESRKLSQKFRMEAGLPVVADADADGSVTVSDLHFTYSSRRDHPVLAGVTFRASPRSLTAVVGQSGSGKSSILGIVCGLYKPTAGTVLISGVDLRSEECSEKWMREQVTDLVVLLFIPNLTD
jgi:ABC-type bacteriocin/lantibiotic exporter with double-glycine peptidase domain